PSWWLARRSPILFGFPMRAFLRRRWFLLLLGAGIAAALARPDWLRPPADRFPVRVGVVLSLGLTALGLEARRLWGTLRRPGYVLWALAVTFGLVPSLAWVLGLFLPMTDLQLGLFLMASMPCTMAAAVLWTRLAGGNEALTLLVVVLTTGLSWLVTT